MAAWQSIRHAIAYPTGIDFASNGLLRPDQLRQSMAPGLGMISLHPNASRAFDVLQFNCWHETGQQLTVASHVDAYRPLTVQEAAFLARMLPKYDPVRCTTTTRFWRGQLWWLRRGMAQCATPGTSNHGWGLAFDAAWWTGDKIAKISTNRWAFAWLEANVMDHGFAWGNKTEPWHLEFWAGDATPEKVLNLERLFGTVV